MLAVSSSALSVSAHVLAGGRIDDGVLTALLLVGVAAAGTALAGRRRGLGGILLVLGLTQVVQHVLFGVADHGHTAPALVDPVLMTTGHALAALGTAVLLVNAESALFALFSALGIGHWRRPAPLPATSPPRLPAPVGPAPVLRDLLLARLRTRRGPPALS